jgi:hypothetical protein
MAVLPPEFFVVTHLYPVNLPHIANIFADNALRYWHIPLAYTSVVHALDALLAHLVAFCSFPSALLGSLLLHSAMLVAMNSLSSDSLVLATLLSAFLVALFAPSGQSPILSLWLAYLPSLLH